MIPINKRIEELELEHANYGEGILERQIRYNEKRWRIVTVYCRAIKETFEELEKRIEEVGDK